MNMTFAIKSIATLSEVSDLKLQVTHQIKAYKNRLKEIKK
jgi:hypothetical protein